tara:strand:- start:5891 stop:7237 length:1347 start_codon:yes stop_codon:yes gene_type:complete
MKVKISIIIRTKNEERWILKCLEQIKKQTLKNYEIILVDNNSTDKTVEKAYLAGVKKIFFIKKFLPGKALNLGIKKSIGEYIVCLSAHCIPTNKNWLKNLIKNFELEKNVAGVYGRQEPMEFSRDTDKRDLFLVFGLDRKVQVKDSFFHNANSIIKKSVWKKIKFDEKISNIEDRLWGEKVIQSGYKLIYEPSASVFHHHGIHQDGNQSRLRNVINIIQSYSKNFTQGNLDPKKLNIVAIIPTKGSPKRNGKKLLIKHTIEEAKNSKFIKKIIVSTDNKETKRFAIKNGAECPFLRPKKLSFDEVNLRTVQKFSLAELEKKRIFPDLIVHLEETYPFRDKDLIDNTIKVLLKNGYDTVIAAKEEKGWLWKESANGYFRIEEGDIPGKIKKKTFLGLHGLCCVTYPEFVRNGLLIGKNIGLFPVRNHLSIIEIRNNDAYKKFGKILKKY